MADLILTRKPGNNTYVINGPTVIGRENVVGPSLAGRLRGYYSEAEASAVKVTSDPHVSRAQLFFHPDTELGGYRAVDISENGTFCNRRKMEKSISYAVGQSDFFSLGDIELVVQRVPYRRVKHFGLIVGDDGKDLGSAITNNTANLSSELIMRNYRWNIRTLVNVSKDLILGSLEEIANLATDDSKTTFFFSGHGNNGYGLLIRNSFLGEYLSSNEFFEALKKIKGKHGIILDCCNAGHFVKNPSFDRSRTAILVASLIDGVAWNNEEQGIAFGRFTRKFLDYCASRKSSFSLNDPDLLEYLRNKLSTYPQVQVPDFAGCEFVLSGRL